MGWWVGILFTGGVLLVFYELDEKKQEMNFWNGAFLVLFTLIAWPFILGCVAAAILEAAYGDKIRTMVKKRNKEDKP